MSSEWLKPAAAAEEEREEHWISVSDLMSGLMIVFLFVALSYMIDVVQQRDQIAAQRDRMQDVAATWNESQERLYERLKEEFRDDLPRWNADIDRTTLSIRFNEPSMLFDSGRDEVKADFAAILRDFFPRYVRTVAEFAEHLDEIRIEGHTSSEWTSRASAEEAYILNMRLSQDRARAILRMALDLPGLPEEHRRLARIHLTANGLSSSRPRLLPDGTEDRERSRRVEFRVRTNAETRIVRILEAAQ